MDLKSHRSFIPCISLYKLLAYLWILTSYVPGHRRRSVVVYWKRLLINDNEQQLTRGAEFEFGRLFFGFPNLSQSPLFCCPTLPCLPLNSSWVAGILVLVVGRCRIQMTSTTTTIHHPPSIDSSLDGIL